MILNIVVILFVGLVAFVHYVQGLLTGLISAVLAVLAAALAIGYFEPLAGMLSGGKYNDQAQGVCLIAIFALVFLVGRTLFDKFVPGNVRIPFLLDKIGGAACGVVAGVLGAGVMAIAFQSMPFGPSIAGYARYDLNSDPRSVTLQSPTNNAKVDRTIHNEVRMEAIAGGASHLLIPVDDIVVGLARHLSKDGSLAGEAPLESVHPDLIGEYFGQRIGVETGARITASNKSGTQVEVDKAYLLPKELTSRSGELKVIRSDEAAEKKLTAEGGKRLVAVTVTFKSAAADQHDHLVRLSPRAVRLVTPTASGESWENTYPIGTMQGQQVWTNHPDDFLIMDVSKEDRSAHFVFQVDEAAFEGSASEPAPRAAAAGATTRPAAASAAPAALKFRPGSFIEVKRDARFPLEDVRLQSAWPPGGVKYHPMRKAELFKEPPPAPPTPPVATTTPPTTPPPTTTTPPVTPAPTTTPPVTPTPAPTTPTPPAPAARAPREATDANGWTKSPLKGPPKFKAATDLGGQEIGLPNYDADALTSAVFGHLTDKKFDSLEIEGTTDDAAAAKLATGTVKVAELFVPEGKRMLQVTLTSNPPSTQWDWTPVIAAYTVVDAAGNSYKPNGGYLTTTDASKRFLANYKANAEPGKVAKADKITVGDVTLIFLLPKDQKGVEIRYNALPGGLWLEE